MSIERIDKLIEECAELIQALCKVKRFGWYSYHPDSPHLTNIDQVRFEMDDVVQAGERLEEDMRAADYEHFKEVK